MGKGASLYILPVAIIIVVIIVIVCVLLGFELQFPWHLIPFLV